MEYSQSQGHGFFFENEIRCKVFCLEACGNDTKKLDILPSENKFDRNEGISIKTTGSNTVCCGDISRFFEYDFSIKNTIIIIFYKQNTDKDKVVREIYEIDYNKKLHKSLFGTMDENILKDYIELIKSIPIGKVSKKISDNYKKVKNDLQKTHNMRIQINPKVDSYKQRRVQCSIPKIGELFKNLDFSEFLISHSTDAICRGISISSCYVSGIRKRITRADKNIAKNIIKNKKVSKSELLKQAIILGIKILSIDTKAVIVSKIQKHT